MKSKLILIGGGGHCKSCIDVIEQSGQYKIAGILDKRENIGKTVLGYEIIGEDEQIEKLAREEFSFLVTLGQIRSSEVRKKLYDELVRCKAHIATIISPHAYISKHAVIGQGTIIMHNAVVNADASIGNNCIINTKALIEHDAVVEDHCHISTAAVINGGTVIKQGTFFGSNAVSRESITTLNNAFIKAGSIYLG